LNIGAVETTVIVVHISAKVLGGSLRRAFLAGPKAYLRRVATRTGVAAVQVENWHFNNVAPFAATTGNT